ncbi:unnamed protein product [Toxocara canis]|uniref:Uncharacterized protein n=1 Tax=Toxocara canis TaxID=6265 RepID=A0A183V7C6_TOXCA|nr:unnamed protein product [Toxocara canis]
MGTKNILIVLTSPIQFGIYCSMSEQFRLTVRQLFTSRLLFVAQAQATFHGGKRYSLILVDVEFLEAKRSTIKRRQADKKKIAKSDSTEMGTIDDGKKSHVGRQVSFPESGSPESGRRNSSTCMTK